jgi:hypothetical protein
MAAALASHPGDFFAQTPEKIRLELIQISPEPILIRSEPIQISPELIQIRLEPIQISPELILIGSGAYFESREPAFHGGAAVFILSGDA